jgi:glycosyltransferase involved in cell wall biosynthesis
MKYAQLTRVLRRPKAIAVIVSTAVCIAVVMLWVPAGQHLLAAVFTIGVAIPLMIIVSHSVALTRWNVSLQQALNRCRSQLRPLSESLTKLDVYTHAADLNVGRIAALQHNLQERFEERIDALTRELSKHEKLEGQLDALVAELSEHKKSEARLDALAVELNEHKGRLDALIVELIDHKKNEESLGALVAEVRDGKKFEGRLDVLHGELLEQKKLGVEMRDLERNVSRALEGLSRKITDLHSEASGGLHKSIVHLPQSSPKESSQISTNRQIQLPLVSIVITNHNYARFLGEAIKSCLSQDYANLEILVVDDGSQDNSIELAEEALAQCPRSRIIRGFINRGHGSAMHEGFRQSSGDYVSFLDADDVFFPDFVATHVYTHLALPWQIAFTSSDQVHLGPTGRVLTGTSGNIRRTFLSAPIENDVKLSPLHISSNIDGALDDLGSKINRCIYLPPALPGYHWGPTSSLCFKRAAVEQIAIEDLVRQVRISGDFYYTLSHYINGSAVIDSKLGAYRIHEKNNFSGEVHLDGVDASHSMPRNLFIDILRTFARCVTNEQLEQFANLLGHNWLYPEMLISLQKYAALVNKTPGQDTRLFAHAILENLERFTQVIGRDFTIHLLHNKLDVTLAELQQRKLL